MARIDNVSFYLRDYVFDSSVGNYGIKLAGQNRNIVLNLGKEIARLSLTALCENPTNYAALKKEFNKGELLVVEVDDDTRYYAYPDVISIRRVAANPLLGEYTDWRVAEMSFLLVDPVVYGSENCTSTNITSDSNTTGILKNISIGGIDETPLSIDIENYNVSIQEYNTSNTDGEWFDFGLGDGQQIEWEDDTHTWGGLHANKVQYDGIYTTPTEMWRSHRYNTSYDSVMFQIDVNSAEMVTMNWTGSGFTPPPQYGTIGVVVWNEVAARWENVGTKMHFRDTFQANISISPNHIRNSAAYVMFKNTNLSRINASLGKCTAIIFRNPELRLPITYHDDQLRYVEVNASTVREGTVKVQIYPKGSSPNTIGGAKLAEYNYDSVNWSGIVKIPIPIESTSDLILRFTSPEAIETVPTTWLQFHWHVHRNTTPHFKVQLFKLSTSSIDTNLLTRYNQFANPNFVFMSNYGTIPNIYRDYKKLGQYEVGKYYVRKGITGFDVWENREEDIKYQLNDFLLGKYDTNYLENLKFTFEDDCSSLDLVFTSLDATSNGSQININTSGFVIWKLNPSYSFITNPYIKIDYDTIPSKIEFGITDLSVNYETSVPSSNVSKVIYNVGSSLITYDKCYLKMWGPALINKFNFYGESSAYLFSLPNIQVGDNEVRYEVDGNYINGTATLCWREVIS